MHDISEFPPTRRSVVWILTAALAALVCTAVLVIPAGAAAAQSDPVAVARKEAEAAKAEAEKARAKVKDVSSRAQAAAAELSAAVSGIERLTDEIAAKEAGIVEAEATEAQLKGVLAGRAASLYKKASGSAASEREADDSPEGMLAEARRAVLAGTVSRRDSQVADEYRAAATLLEEQRAQLAADRETLEAQKTQLESRKKAVDAQLAEAQRAADAAAAAAQREVAALAAAEKKAAEAKRVAEAQRLAAERAAAERRAASTGGSGGSGGGDGSIRCPIAGAVTFSNDWGNPRSGGRGHGGTDLYSAHGTPNVAVVSGSIMQQNERLGGISVYLIGDNGYTYYYTHLSGYGASGRVSAGTVIGYTGNTGNASGGVTHTHFEIRKGGPNGAKSNPYPILRSVC